jgi:nitrogen permease regulator 3-like protein
MAETLLAVLLVTSSSNSGSSLAFRWPPSPAVSPRLARPRLQTPALSGVDHPWRAITSGELVPDAGAYPAAPAAPVPIRQNLPEDNLDDYEWRRPDALRDRSLSHSHSHSHSASVPPSGRSSPLKDGAAAGGSVFEDAPAGADEYDDDALLGYAAAFLAGVLCPPPAMCHQKFELTVDDLAFVGHPVCADADGVWREKAGRARTRDRVRRRRRQRRERGRGRRASGSEQSGVDEDGDGDADGDRDEDRNTDMDSGASSSDAKPGGARLQTFHFVLVLDRPDPSSAASGNLAKYYDVVYNQLAFTFTAVLFQEQIRSNFVEAECDALGAMKDQCTKDGEPAVFFVCLRPARV